MTDEELAHTFGPCWRSVVHVIRQAKTMSKQQANTLAIIALRTMNNDVERNDRYAALDAARISLRGAERYKVWTAAWSATFGSARIVAAAATSKDLVGSYGYTQENYDALVGAWESIMGPIIEEES